MTLTLVRSGNYVSCFSRFEEGSLGYPHLCTLIQDTKFVGNCRPMGWGVP